MMYNAVTSHRTQIYLPEELYKKAKKVAKKKDVSLAWVVRDALSQYQVEKKSRKEEKKKSFEEAKNEFLKLAGLFSGPSDLAKNHDDYY